MINLYYWWMCSGMLAWWVIGNTDRYGNPWPRWIRCLMFFIYPMGGMAIFALMVLAVCVDSDASESWRTANYEDFERAPLGKSE